MSRPARLIQTYCTRVPCSLYTSRLSHCAPRVPRLAPRLAARRQLSNRALHGESVTVQPVRIRKWWSRKRIITIVLGTLGAVSYAGWFLPEGEYLPMDEEDDEDEEEEEEEEEGEEESSALEKERDENALIVPLTPAWKLPREFYKGTDPEWQEFKKIAPDKKKVQKIFSELANIVANGLSQLPSTVRIMGKDTKVRRYWLDVDFPYGPPQEYARFALAFGSGYLALTVDVIDQEHYDRQTRVLWPKGFLNGIIAYSQTIWGFQVKRIKEALGMDTKPQPGTQQHRMDHMLRMVQAREAAQMAKNQATNDQPDMDGSSTAAGDGTNRPDVSSVSQNRHDSPDLPEQPRKWYLPSMQLGWPSEGAEATVAKLVFANSLQQSNKPKSREPPRGSFAITGVLQASGNKAAMMFEVLAFYDPKTSRFSFIEVSPRSMKVWKQAPKGGP